MRARALFRLFVVGLVGSASSACAVGAYDDPPLVDSGPLQGDDVPHDANPDPIDTAKSTPDAQDDEATDDAATDPSTAEDSAKDAIAHADAKPDAHETAADASIEAHADATLDCAPVINEVQTGGTTAADEFVEITNPCAAAIDLAGYRIAYRSRSNVASVTAADFSVVYTFGASTPLAPGAWFVVAGVDFAGAKDALESSGGSKGMLSSIGGQIGLRDPSGALLDGVFYGSLPTTGKPAFLEGTPANAPSSGSSIYRHPDGTDSDDNGADFSDVVPTPTPDAQNP